MSFEISSPQFSKSDLGDWSSIKDIEPSPSKPRFFGLTESALGLLSGSREKPSTSPPPAGPRWVPDSEASVCFCCEDAFSFKHRRHHCRSCGNVVCRSCSGSRLHLASMGFGAPQRACDICVAAFELFRAGESLSRISGFLNWFLGTETCLSVAERKEALVLQVSEEQQQNLVEPEKFLRMNGMSSLMAFDHLAQTKALEFEQQEEEDEKEENETIALYKTGVAIAQSRIRTKLSSGILSSASSESIRSEDSVCFEEYLMKEALNRRMAIASEFPLPETAEKDDASLKNLVNKLFEIRLFGAVFIVKEQSVHQSKCFRPRLLIITPGGQVCLSGRIPRMSRDELLALPSVQISLRSIRDVRLIDSVDMEEVSFNDSIKSESHSRNHSRNASIGDLDNSNFSVSDGNSLNSKLADRSFDLITSISHSSAKEVEKLLYNDNIEGNVLRIRWKSRSSMKPWNLVVLDYEGCANELYLRECYHVIKTHRQMAEFRVKTTVSMLEEKCEMLKTPVDWKNRTHEKAFKRIWRQLKGKDEEFPGQKSEQWKSLGFQGADPQTDFRGMGWLALDAMVYWSEKHSTIAKEMVRNQDERTYPLCTAVINCVSLAVRLLFRPESASDTGPMARIPSNFYSDEVQKSDLFQLLCYSRSEEDPFYEFLVVMLRVMDRLSVEMQAGYMDFPRVLNAVEQTLRFHLSRKPRELSTLFKWLWTPT